MSSLPIRQSDRVKSLLTVLPALVAAVAVLAGTCAAQGAITLSQDFDSGSLNVAGSTIDMSNPSAPSILLAPRYNCWTQNPSQWGWLYFRADGVNNTTPQFRVPTAGGYLSQGMTVCYSYDNITWYYFAYNGAGAGNFYFYNYTPFTQNTVYIAQNLPYPTWQTDQYMATMKANPYVSRTASGDANFAVAYTHGTAGRDTNGNLYYDDLGRTIPSFPLYGFKIGDANATGPKIKVVIQCGNHSCESLSHYMMEGMIQVVLGNTPEGNLLRQQAVFYIYPAIDPEGRWAGYWRSTPIAPYNDHNRYWADANNMANGYASPTQNPEIYAIEQAERVDTGGNIGYFFDIHTQSELDSYPVVTQNTLTSVYIQKYRLRDPVDSSNTLVWGPFTMAEYWAADPISQGGLAATYSLTPEIGMFANLTVAECQRQGAQYMLALYDTLPAGTGNHAPVVNAGADQSIHLPAMSVSLAGTVSDDGLPAGAAVTSTWTVTSGPGAVTFTNASSPATTASFSTLGTYILRLTASDTALSAYDEVQVVVSPAPVNLAPVVNAGMDKTLVLPTNNISLTGTVSDDGLPLGAAVTATWTLISGPGAVTFASLSSPATTVTFSTSGTYVLRLTATDTALSAFDECTLTVQAPSPLTLLLHLPFDEGAGTLAADTSGNNRTGTLAGGATWMTGKAGSAVLFNRTTSQVTVPDFPLTSAFSVSFWFKPTEIAGDTYQYLFSWGPPPSAGANALNVWICGVGVTDFPGWLRTTVQDTNDGYAETLDVNTSSYILDGNWHFYCLTVSKSAGCQVYVDGQFRIGDPNRGGDSIDPNSAVFIGARSDGNVDRHYGGGIDDVRIYGQALAASDVQALYVGLPANAAPTANAGANQKVMIPNALTLAGTVSDDGQPTPPAVCTAAWSLVSGPGTVTFANPAAASTTATFATAGTYVLMLTASDSALTATSTVTVTALAPGDFNGDGRVDGVDFLIWQSHYPRSSGGTPDGGDANGDGQVDGVDFLVWQSHYQG